MGKNKVGSSKIIMKLINSAKDIANSIPISSIAIVFFSKDGICYTNTAIDNNGSVFELLGGITHLRTRVEHEIEMDKENENKRRDRHENDLGGI